MLPTLNIAGDVVLTERISWYFLRRISFGDVVLCDSPIDPTRTVCKRVMGLPGDLVCKDPTEAEPEWIVVPKGTVWLLGDNLPNSNDSRLYGPVPMGLLRGHVLMRLYPRLEFMTNLRSDVTEDELIQSGIGIR
eukprot:jgi/Hompol1/926/HPOL_005460-RA